MCPSLLCSLGLVISPQSAIGYAPSFVLTGVALAFDTSDLVLSFFFCSLYDSENACEQGSPLESVALEAVPSTGGNGTYFLAPLSFGWRPAAPKSRIGMYWCLDPSSVAKGYPLSCPNETVANTSFGAGVEIYAGILSHCTSASFCKIQLPPPIPNSVHLRD